MEAHENRPTRFVTPEGVNGRMLSISNARSAQRPPADPPQTRVYKPRAFGAAPPYFHHATTRAHIPHVS
jgi:hypothetical protein